LIAGGKVVSELFAATEQPPLCCIESTEIFPWSRRSSDEPGSAAADASFHHDCVFDMFWIMGGHGLSSGWQ
jgi:hypothetical protein